MNKLFSLTNKFGASLAAVALVAASSSAEGATLVVNGVANAPTSYATVQTALAASGPTDIIDLQVAVTEPGFTWNKPVGFFSSNSSPWTVTSQLIVSSAANPWFVNNMTINLQTAANATLNLQADATIQNSTIRKTVVGGNNMITVGTTLGEQVIFDNCVLDANNCPTVSAVNVNTSCTLRNGTQVLNLTGATVGARTQGAGSVLNAFNASFSNCGFAGVAVTNATGIANVVNSSLATASANTFPMANTAGGTLNSSDCTFTWGAGGWISADAGTINVIRPTVTGSNTGPIAILLNAGSPTVNVAGVSAASKFNAGALFGNGLLRLARLRSGTLNFTDVSVLYVGAVVGIDSNPSLALAGNVQVNLNRCLLAAEAGAIDLRSGAASAFNVGVSATNTAWYANSNDGFLILIADANRTGTGALTFTHSTIKTGTSQALILGNAGDTITGNFSIFDASNVTQAGKPASNLALLGTGNIAYNGVDFTSGGFASVPGDTITAFPNLDFTGQPQDPSPAIGGATASTQPVDINGKARPAGSQTARDIGAYEMGDTVSLVSDWAVY